MRSTCCLNHILGASKWSIKRCTVFSTHNCADGSPCTSGNAYWRAIRSLVHSPHQHKGSTRDRITHRCDRSPRNLSVRNPEMASRPRWATLRFPSSRFCTSNLPYPYIDGKRQSRSSQLRRGSIALNSVINSPLGFERYPTAPSSTRVGDHRGSVTDNHQVLAQLFVQFYGIKNSHELWNT